MVGYDPFAPDVMADPLPVYERLRAEARAHPLPQYDAWALPRFDDVWEVSQDRERFSIVEGPIFVRDRLIRSNEGAPDNSVGRPLRSFSMVDPPDHTVLRKAMVDPFRPRAVASLEQDVRGHVRLLLDELVPAGRFDAVRDLGSPVAAVATCRLLGLPDADHDAIVRWVNAFTRRDPGQPGMTADGRRAQAELGVHLTEFTSASRGAGGIVDAIAAVAVGSGEPLSDADVATQLVTLLVGGVETLPKIVAGGLLRLLHHPGQRAELVAEPSLVANAFEEIMRLEAVLQWVGRTLLVDAEVAGQAMRAGQRVFLLLVSANHDEREFTDPERFDVHRRFRRTLVFGHGVHFCIGAHAARMEGRVLLEELLARIPEYGIDEPGMVRPPSEFQIGYTSMPVLC